MNACTFDFNYLTVWAFNCFTLQMLDTKSLNQEVKKLTKQIKTIKSFRNFPGFILSHYTWVPRLFWLDHDHIQSLPYLFSYSQSNSYLLPVIYYLVFVGILFIFFSFPLFFLLKNPIRLHLKCSHCENFSHSLLEISKLINTSLFSEQRTFQIET